MQHSESFLEKGYTVIDDVLSTPFITKIKSDIKTVFLSGLKNIGIGTGQFRDRNLDDIYTTLKAESPALKGRCYDLLGRLDSVNQALTANRITDVVRTIYGTPIITDNFQVRIDDMTNDRLLPVHQEFAQMALFNATVWLPLNDVDSETTGGLRIEPGSHKKGIVKHTLYKEPAPYYGIEKSLLDESKLVNVSIKAGSALVFHPFLFHGSVPNFSGNIRWTLVGRMNEISSLMYIKSENQPMKYPIDRDDPAYQAKTILPR